MFHCNGWCFPWTVSVVAGTHVCLRAVRAKTIYDLIADHGVTHMCGAPVVLNMMSHASDEAKARFPQTVEIMTGGAAPPTGSAAAEAVLPQGSVLAERVMRAVDLQRTQPPPRSMVVDIPEVEGLRLVVSVRSGGHVTVTPAANSANAEVVEE